MCVPFCLRGRTGRVPGSPLAPRESLQSRLASTARFEAEAVRDRLRKRGFLPEKVVRYCYRPFDLRWLYWEPEAGLLDRNRAEYFPHVVPGNRWLVTQQKPR